MERATNPTIATIENNDKGKRKSDDQIFFDFFSSHTTTVYDFEKQAGISRSDGCRYKRKFEKMGLLQVLYLGKCPVSGEHGVQFLTTDTTKFKGEIQLKMF